MHNINFKQWNPNAHYAVIDDVAWPFNSWREFLGCQNEFNATQKYLPIRNLKYGKPTIYLTNIPVQEWSGMNPHDYQWIQGNARIVTLEKPFY